MLETGVAGNDRRARPHRHRQQTDRLCRVEKPETGRVSKVQQFRLHQLQGLGHRTKIIDSKAGVDNLIKGLSKGVYAHDL